MNATENKEDVKKVDAQLMVTFYKRLYENSSLTAQAGRPISEEKEFVRILNPGNPYLEIDTIADNIHKDRFAEQYYRFLNNQKEAENIVGTPLAEWPLISRNQAEALRAQKFYTVEHVANASDLQLQSISMAAGMNVYAFRDKAKAYLERAEKSAEIMQKETEINDLRRSNELLNYQLGAMQENFDKMEKMLNVLKEEQQKPKRVRRLKAVQPKEDDDERNNVATSPAGHQ